MSKNTVTRIVPQLISTEDTYKVRLPVLRKGKPITTCYLPGDDLETTIHLGGFLDDKLITIASFFDANNEQYDLKNAYQLRGMAVLEDYHGRGFGQQLLLFGEQLLQEKKVKTIWMNARVSALGFYEKLGYQTIGTVFEVPGVGEHYVMFKSFK
ncbi:GNAT family N-acetyltransferase [Cellulophaga sp. HaHaR_3_176]|uniref:GNAT family N-acetyltransferase n=1 Tax=Cellulophaga sp. HaHaR_3_176 TaxID=1942464 RepID=UPI001C1F704B|nr:GNAT family N-acetyltransferase [Cellulophaga sp. HaHaR_3_176]QWX84289.1 GNAT family N-acetyltransferase [Cellulophaga sp. HaHaR_3_176]